ncbi:MAG: lipopolysaccharide transport periplasmic protein LptA [Pseudomonadota bacterium]
MLLLNLPLTVGAAKQGDAPITVEADRLEINQQTGVSIYQGNVRLQQDTLLLQAQRLELHSTEGQVQKAYAEGSPVHLEHEDTETGMTTRAEASHMEYRLSDGVMELKGDARLWRGRDEFSGNHLIYDTDNNVVKAFGDTEKDDKGRVRVILQPKEDDTDE